MFPKSSNFFLTAIETVRYISFLENNKTSEPQPACSNSVCLFTQSCNYFLLIIIIFMLILITSLLYFAFVVLRYDIFINKLSNFAYT